MCLVSGTDSISEDKSRFSLSNNDFTRCDQGDYLCDKVHTINEELLFWVNDMRGYYRYFSEFNYFVGT